MMEDQILPDKFDSLAYFIFESSANKIPFISPTARKSPSGWKATFEAPKY